MRNAEEEEESAAGIEMKNILYSHRKTSMNFWTPTILAMLLLLCEIQGLCVSKLLKILHKKMVFTYVIGKSTNVFMRTDAMFMFIILV